VLLAKSNPQYGLRKHTDDVLAALCALRLIWPQIPASLDTAAIFHDLGKAATGFQQMLLQSGNNWRFRHEVLSAEIFRQCYDVKEDDVLPSYIAVLTHHKNLGAIDAINIDFRQCYSQRSTASWFEKWPELLANVNQLKEEFFHLDSHLDAWTYKADTQSPANEVPELKSHLKPVFEDNALAIARGALVAADHLASASLARAMQGKNITLALLENHAINKINDWNGWSGMQLSAGAKSGSAMLIAPTGAGKTEASLLWALANRKHYERVFYVLPYQVAINAMADRIAQAFPDEEGHTRISSSNNVAILHSNVDLAYLQDALNDELPVHQAYAVALAKKDAARKIYAPVKVTTVYQLLDIFFGRKFFEVGLLELTDSLIIFDEIHAYDGHTFGLILVLLEYLQKLNARIFIMTATLPETLKGLLAEAAGIEKDQQVQLAETSLLLKEIRRKIISHDGVIEEAIKDIRESVKGGKKTVVVCNTVSKAIRLWKLFSDLQPLLIHSRFTLGHRAERETKENIQKYSLVIATQVIEVSLDVSFESMFTELAPADSLLQRFGRVNRHGKCGPENLGMCHVFTGDDRASQRVYDPKLLELTREHLPKQPLTFRTACDWMEAVYPQGLSHKERDAMINARESFGEIVSRLTPMLELSSDNKSTELTLFESVQVIPEKYAAVWAELKEARKHLEAKQFVVNVNLHSWQAAESNSKKNGVQAHRMINDWKIAQFNYDECQGLLLNEHISTRANAVV
jgi:CRISPR-associated endonuclease/helicase Cas3